MNRPRRDFTRSGERGVQRQINAGRVVVEGEVGRHIGKGWEVVDHRDVEVSDGGPTAVVRPDLVGRLRPHFGRCAPNRTVARLEGQAAWQAGVDGPGEDVARSCQGRIQRQVRADGVVGQREVRRSVGEGRELVDHRDVEIGLGGAPAVVRPNRVRRGGPQLGRCTVERPVVWPEGKAAWQGVVDGPRGDFTRSRERRCKR